MKSLSTVGLLSFVLKKKNNPLKLSELKQPFDLFMILQVQLDRFTSLLGYD